MRLSRMIALIALAALAAALSGCGSRFPGTREGVAYRIGEKDQAYGSDAALMKAAGLKSSEYRLEESERDGAVVRTYVLKDRPSDARKAMAKTASSIEALRGELGSLRLKDVAARLGKPDELMVLDFGQRGSIYNAYYGNVDFCSVGEDAAVLEIRIENSGKPAAPTPYKYKSALGIGSRIEEVFAVLGQPLGTAEYELSPENLDRILQSKKGRDLSYIAYLGEGVRFFSSGGLVDAMYLFRPDPSLDVKR